MLNLAQFQVGDAPAQSAEDAGVVALANRTLWRCNWVAVDGSGHHLHWGDQEIGGLGKEGDGWSEFDLHDGEQDTRKISGRGKWQRHFDNSNNLGGLLIHRHPLDPLDLHEQSHQVPRNPALGDQSQLGAFHKIWIVGDGLADG